MQTLRVLRPSGRSLLLSNAFRQAHRASSTTSPPTNTATSTPPVVKPSFLSRNRGRLAWLWIASLLGWMGGSLASHTLAPPPLPESGSHEDSVLINDLNKRIDGEFKVKVLRGKCLGVPKKLKGEEGGWVEIVPNPLNTAEKQSGNLETTSSGKRLMEALAGARGLGVERIFWDRGEHQLVAVVWFGGSISGWPGVTHGGAIATVLGEKLALAASLASDTSFHDISEAAMPQRMPGTGSHATMFAPAASPNEPAQLSLSYVKPTHANDFYIIRVSPALPMDQEPENIIPSDTAGGHEWEATLEKAHGKDVGQICVKAKARFAASSTTERGMEKVKESGKRSYQQFKDWMWPSRQQSST